MKSRLQMGVSVGGPTILMIFVALSLATLSTLSLVTAKADQHLSEKNADYIQQYYQADNGVEEFLAQVQKVLNSSKTQAETIAAFNQMDHTSVLPQEDGSLLIGTFKDINGNQALVLQLHAPSQEDKTENSPWRILSWRVENRSYWDYDAHQLTFDDLIVEIE